MCSGINVLNICFAAFDIAVSTAFFVCLCVFVAFLYGHFPIFDSKVTDIFHVAAAIIQPKVIEWKFTNEMVEKLLENIYTIKINIADPLNESVTLADVKTPIRLKLVCQHAHKIQITKKKPRNNSYSSHLAIRIES